MLVLFGLCMFMVAQELKTQPEPSFEIMDVLEVKGGKNVGDVGKLVDSADKKDKNFEQPQVAVNKAQNSRGEYGHAVLEAPKGGMVNEGPVVGTDEGLVVDGKTKKIPTKDAANKPAAAEGVKVQASRKNEDQKKLPLPNGPDLLKLNEINEKSDNVKNKVKDTAPGQEQDTSVDESGKKIVDPKTAKIIDNRMHQKVDEMNKLQEGEKAEVKDDTKNAGTKETNADTKELKGETKEINSKESNPQAAQEHYENAIADDEDDGKKVAARGKDDSAEVKTEKKSEEAPVEEKVHEAKSHAESVANQDLRLGGKKSSNEQVKAAKKSEGTSDKDDAVVKKDRSTDEA